MFFFSTKQLHTPVTLDEFKATEAESKENAKI